jgi:acyl carrier protein
MQSDRILEKIIPIVSETLRVDRDVITRDTRLQDMKVQSLDMVTISMEIEDEFGRQMFTDYDHSFTTVGDIVDFVSKQIESNGE